jgi:hypothetical protein
MSTCLKPYFQIENSQLDWSIYHFCGLFALVDDLLCEVNVRKLERADYILKNIRRFRMTVNAPVDNDVFIERMVNRAREMAFSGDLNGYLLQEAAIELCQADENDFEQKWYRFTYYYFLDRIDSIKKAD